MIQFIPVEAIGVTEISSMNKSGYDKLDYEINKSNIFLEKISKSLNKTNTMNEGQNLASENITNYLQEIGHSLKQTNALLTDLNSSYKISFDLTERLETIRFQAGILVAIEASLIGAGTALIGERIIAKQTEKRQIEKTHELVNDDLSRIYDNANTISLELESLISKIKYSTKLEDQIFSSHGEIGPDLSRINTNILLLHWNAIVHSGYLIKLKTNEIRKLQSLQNYLEDVRVHLWDYYNKSTLKIVEAIKSGNTEQVIKSQIKNELNGIFVLFHYTYPKVVTKLYEIEQAIDWINLEQPSQTISCFQRIIKKVCCLRK